MAVLAGSKTIAAFHAEVLGVEDLHESAWNPRKHCDQDKLLELAASLREKGVLTPLIVRPRHAGGYELGAGHRRYRAAKLADLVAVPCVIREMTDTEFLELLVIENDQREDVHPLEQADGYKRLMLQDGYDAKRIADRIGRSEKFVYDRVKLLGLTPLAQQLFLAGKMTAGHAILLARLRPDEQARAIGKPEEDDYRGRLGGLFEQEDALLSEDDRPAPKGPLASFDGVKPVSVRELDGWIAEHVRFDATKADPFLFPAVVTAVEEAPKPLVPITYNHHVQDEARDGTVRTYGPASWKEAKKACPYTQGAVIVVGEGRGDVLQVCLSSHRDQCATHWAKEKKAAEARRKQLARGGSTRRADNTYEKQEASRKIAEGQREALRARYKKAAPAIVAALALAIDKAPLARLEALLLEFVKPDTYDRPVVKPEDFYQPGKSADAILRRVAFCATLREASIYQLDTELQAAGKTWGVDVKAILEKGAPAPEPAAKVQTAAKKKAKRGA